MKKSVRPPQQILIGAAVEFLFASEVTLSDSEISSGDARHKPISGTSTVFPLFGEK
jgi:hypothetical protein